MSETLLPNIVQFLSQIDPFDKLPQSILTKLSSVLEITYLNRGDVIDPCQEGGKKYLYIIRTGSMEQRKLDGVLRARLGAEDLFGFTFLDNELAHDDGYTATALDNTLLYLMPQSALLSLFEENPEYAEHFASQAEVRLKSALNVVWNNKEKSLFIKRVDELASKRFTTVDAEMSICDVAKEMRIKQKTSSAVVCHSGKIVGIITDRDMTKRVIADGTPIDRPIKEVMTKDPVTVKPEDLVLHAASTMMQYNIRDLPVVSNNKVVGLLTTSHLVKNHRIQAIFLIEKIKYANSIEELELLTPERQAIFEALVEGKVTSATIGKVMTLIMDSYVRRLIGLAKEQFGEPPCEFAWIVAGSHARNEVHMLSDQDSAIVLTDEATESDREYFLKLATMVSNGLDACGYPLCPGNYMASNPDWCQPMSVWKAYYKKWVENPEYERLLNISVFLEVRAICGNLDFGEKLHACLHKSIESNPEFLGSLVNDAVSVSPPLGIFNSLVLERNGENANTLNIKKYAINLIIDLARIYGLAVECHLTGTEERFAYANEKKILSDDSLKNIIGAYQFISQYRFSHQLEALKAGEVPDNNIDPEAFGSFERKHLKDAFKIIADLQAVAKFKFSNGG